MLRHLTLARPPMQSVLKQFDLSGRVALITGSSAGIGLALAQGLAGAGAAAVLNARNATKLQAAAQALRALGATVHALCFDVTDARAVADAVAKIESEIGPIDIVQIGLGGEMTLPINTLVAKEFELRGSFRFHAEFATAVQLLNQRLVDLKPLISATLPYRDAGKAFALAADRSQAMKVLLNFD
jgi:NAD(P)-dependent dehydrogenase (short-subunit alcohol dehydrogenase family)